MVFYRKRNVIELMLARLTSAASQLYAAGTSAWATVSYWLCVRPGSSTLGAMSPNKIVLIPSTSTDGNLVRSAKF